jgi:hypothetical protein
MAAVVTKKVESRVVTFSKWIEPESKTDAAIVEQRASIRSNIKGQAEADGLKVKSTPDSGSFAKKTGLRRHMRGEHEVEGQDVDVCFVVHPKTSDEERIEDLLTRFLRYANASYPDTDKKPTKSSIQLNFVGSKLAYDLVPLLATADPERQILIRSNGERRETSIQKHVEFIKARTSKSEPGGGSVRFNQCVRMFKWWRDVQQAKGGVLEEVPSILIDLLCAKAFDKLGTKDSLVATLAAWMGFMTNVVEKRKDVYFDDYIKTAPPASNGTWMVLDPVNFDNNVVAAWPNYHIDELANWLASARDRLADAIAADLQGDDVASLDALVEVFGNAIKNHGGDE